MDVSMILTNIRFRENVDTVTIKLFCCLPGLEQVFERALTTKPLTSLMIPAGEQGLISSPVPQTT